MNFDLLSAMTAALVRSFDGICSASKELRELFGMDGLAFAGNGAGGYYVMNPDGKIYLYEYVGEDGECYANTIMAYISKTGANLSKL